MRKIIYSLVMVFMTLNLTACGDLIRSLREDSAAADGNMPRKRQAAREESDERVFKRRTLSGLSANNVPSYSPPVQREYNRGLASISETEEQVGAGVAEGISSTRRLTRKDFVDNNAGENSLWNGQGQNNYLFSHNKRHELGDVTTVDVERELKREIQYALFMNLPPEQRKVRKPASVDGDKAKGALGAAAKAAADGKSELEKGKDAAEEAAKVNLASNGKEDDIMRMEVVESTGGGMVRMMGQKRVIYRGVSRVIEIVALANAKDVDEGGRIKSSNFIDTKTQVVQ